MLVDADVSWHLFCLFFFRREHCAVDGAMVKDVILDEKNQVSTCRSARGIFSFELNLGPETQT